jgi:hypothetical protein
VRLSIKALVEAPAREEKSPE